jgi:NADH:ubiquinone oxidoreductase subunit 2 (subunit N)
MVGLLHLDVRVRHQDNVRWKGSSDLTSSFSSERKHKNNIENDGTVREAYWNKKFIATTIVIILLAVLTAYLQYAVYPSIMQNQFGETQVSVHLSILTYTIDAFRCITSESCVNVRGLPAFDFAQLFVIVLVAMQIYHYIARRNI